MATSREMTAGRALPLIFNFHYASVDGKPATTDILSGRRGNRR